MPDRGGGGGPGRDPAGGGTAPTSVPTSTSSSKGSADLAQKRPTFPGPVAVPASTAVSTPGSYVDFHFGMPCLKRIDFSLQSPMLGPGEVYALICADKH
ncbi:hypothetical protein GCM10009838_45750 [Catenulispora subtropica]|uniref:Uncharacterized protein n=1 Tax=Catenulispora subtropica TaxID=450798 RepID=A0ABP5DFX4_9ACTN